jgi:hypothetical protein
MIKTQVKYRTQLISEEIGITSNVLCPKCGTLLRLTTSTTGRLILSNGITETMATPVLDLRVTSIKVRGR